MNQLISQNFGAVSTQFAGTEASNDLSSGIQAGFGLIGYRGKVWSIRYRGEERQLMRDDGDGPRNSVEVVMLRASSVISKIWYSQGYVEGSNASPDCFSTNGLNPDAGSAKPQSPVCASCPRNAWGSRITPAGKQGKECSDSKRIAIVPLADLRNETFGGPMLLRIPAASLQDLAQFGTQMQKLGYPYYSIGIRIAFDPQESYPKFVFSAIRPLADTEAATILELRNDPAVDRIIAEGSELAPVQAAVTTQQVFEQPAETAPVQPAPAQTQAAQPAPAQATPVQAAPVQPAPAQAAPVQTAPVQAASPSTGFGPVTTEPSASPQQPAPTQAAPEPQPQPASTGFGPMTAEAKDAGAPDVSANETASQVEPAPATQGDTSASNDFEAQLDAQLNDLLPSGT